MERETMCIQAGYSPKNGESRMIPIIQSTPGSFRLLLYPSPESHQ